ncbi:MAG TPA: M56 family metallopeptidase [Fimbriimonadaceae bacterium]|nr:M56 family metallopeptidase [Fimbriimonadaceae bacterium]
MSSGALASEWASWVWSASWQGLLFVAIVWLACLTLRKLPASVKAWLWWLASLRLVIGLVWAGFELPVLPAAPTSPLASLNHRLDLLAPRIVGSGHSVPDLVQGSRLASPTQSLDHANWLTTVLLLMWIIGAIAVAGKIAEEGARIVRLRRTAERADEGRAGQLARELGVGLGLRHKPDVLTSGEISAPMLVGLIRPALMLPKGLPEEVSEEDLRLCVAHELAHMRRRDLLLAVIPTLMQIAFFFFPPAWLIRREWETEREAACDAEALAATGAPPAQYGRLLMKLVTVDHRPAFAPALGATASYHTLKKRILNMKNFTSTPRRFGLAATIVGVLGLLLAIPWQVTARATDTPSEPNVVVNGGFENGAQNWTRRSLGVESDIPIDIDQQTYHSGKASLRFMKTDNTFFPIATMDQDLPWDGKTQFVKISAWIKAENAKKFTLALDQDHGAKGRQWAAYVGDRTSSSGSVTHDWQQYKATLKIAEGTRSVGLSLQMYGPGTIWIDDITASFTDQGDSTSVDEDDALADVKDVSNESLTVGGDPKMRYFLIGAKAPEPASGYKLLVVLPGGDGSADFNPFVRRIWKNALPPGYLVAELVAPKWSDDQFQSIVWPTRKARWATMKFATEDFISTVIQQVGKSHKVDASHVYTLSWSSGGPAAYAASLGVSAIRGSFVAMSVFHEDELPALLGAKGRAYFLLQSPDDKITTIDQANIALQELSKAGAKAMLKTYEGGHGWRGDVYGNIRKGIDWLEQNAGL